MLIDGAYAQEVEITDGLTMLQCEECRYMAGPGYNADLPRSIGSYAHEQNSEDRDETMAAFQYHSCEEEKADAQWYYNDL